MTLSFNPPQQMPSFFFSPSPKSSVIAPKQESIELKGTKCIIQPQVSLAHLTSFRVGGEAQWYVSPRNITEVEASFEWLQKQDIPLTLMGAGSNLLVSDQGVSGLVLCTRHLSYSKFDLETGQVTAAAGEPLPRLAWKAAKYGFKGLEWSVGIPGTVGGAVVMNAGAHISSTQDILVSVKVISPDGKIETLTAKDLNYSYRTSALQNDKRLVIEATFQLQPGFSKEEVRAITSENLHTRKESQPYDKPSCGSVFRNPNSYKAGWLIEQLGLKGYMIGGAQVAQRHANFILNYNQAKANDIFNLINYVQEKVEKHWSICLHPEVKLLGEF
jgi:UDP-N-acetylmuramate dehydrogenase